MKAYFPGPNCPPEIAEAGTTHPILGDLKGAGVKEFSDGLADEVKAAIAAGLLLPAPEDREKPARKKNQAEAPEAAATEKE
jgi:hypothetical protein